MPNDSIFWYTPPPYDGIFWTTQPPEDLSSLARLILQILLLVAHSLNFILNTIGCYILTNLYRMGEESNQRFLIINLSATEAAMSLNNIVKGVVELFPEARKAERYINILRYTGLMFQYFLVMIFITIDRLLEVHLNIKYPVHCTEKRAKLLMLLTWLSTCAIILGYEFGAKFADIDYKDFLRYVNAPLSGIFLILAVWAYVSIFLKFKASREHPVQTTNTTNQMSAFAVFRNSKFFLPVLLISTFIIFTIIPGYVNLTAREDNKVTRASLLYFYEISFAVSNMIDAIIYIFVERKPRQRFFKMIKHCDCSD